MRRSDRSAKLKDPLRVIACGHCQRLMDFMDSPAHAPPGADPKLLHAIPVANPPAYSVLCTCGHYTFYVDDRPDNKRNESPPRSARVSARAAKPRRGLESA